MTSSPPAAADPGQEPFWPDGIRLVVSISMQMEAGAQGDSDNGAPFPPAPEGVPDLIGRSWFDYGVREGIPRLLELWDRHGVKVTSHMVGRAVELHPELAREVVARGHEAAAHGQTWTPHWTMTEEQERASYAANIAAIEHATGTRPVGFNAYWMRGTARTLDILAGLGLLYHTDDLSRDEPWVLRAAGRPFAVVPYTIRNNDIARFDSPALTAAAFARELKDEFDWLYAEAAVRRRMMSVATHDRIGGSPARATALDAFLSYARRHPGVAFLRKAEIAEFILGRAAR